jgi:surface antigen
MAEGFPSFNKAFRQQVNYLKGKPVRTLRLFHLWFLLVAIFSCGWPAPILAAESDSSAEPSSSAELASAEPAPTPAATPDSLPTPIPLLIPSPTPIPAYKGFAPGYCTYYAAQSFDAVAPAPHVNWRGNAGQWLANAASAKAGWKTSTVSREAVVGAIVVWRHGRSGHVAIVEQVSKKESSFPK